MRAILALSFGAFLLACSGSSAGIPDPTPAAAAPADLASPTSPTLPPGATAAPAPAPAAPAATPDDTLVISGSGDPSLDGSYALTFTRQVSDVDATEIYSAQAKKTGGTAEIRVRVRINADGETDRVQIDTRGTAAATGPGADGATPFYSCMPSLGLPCEALRVETGVSITFEDLPMRETVSSWIEGPSFRKGKLVLSGRAHVKP